MRIFIKNMVSLRCKMIVKSELEKHGIAYSYVELGEVETLEDLSGSGYALLKAALLEYGLEMMNDKRAILIEKIKTVVIEMIHYADELPEVNFSTYISNKLEMDYAHLASIFSQTKGITIEHYIILHKIEKVKELLMYDEMSLTQISEMLHYSSPSHLSNQFKKITGLMPSFFKSMRFRDRKALEDL